MSGAVVVLSTGKPTFAVSVAQTNLGATRFGVGTAVTLQTAIATVVGGVAPYTYAWTLVSGDTEIGPIDGTSSATKFSAFFASTGSYSSVYKCVVTDATAATVDSNNINIDMESN
jgi:hypothetical protein